ncbi:hypothetical protein FNJ47_49060, partial [Bradyrhizobium sp. UFLA 03-164]|nr:hypothetical protein [Bradyrhizobium uaiense]
ERVRFSESVPLSAGFERIADIIRDAGRPLTAFGACELRSPAPCSRRRGNSARLADRVSDRRCCAPPD